LAASTFSSGPRSCSPRPALVYIMCGTHEQVANRVLNEKAKGRNLSGRQACDRSRPWRIRGASLDLRIDRSARAVMQVDSNRALLRGICSWRDQSSIARPSVYPEIAIILKRRRTTPIGSMMLVPTKLPLCAIAQLLTKTEPSSPAFSAIWRSGICKLADVNDADLGSRLRR
jgi:hypothetical protein